MPRRVGPWLKELAQSDLNTGDEISGPEIARKYGIEKQSVFEYFRAHKIQGERRDALDVAGRPNLVKFFKLRDIIDHYNRLNTAECRVSESHC